MKGRPNSSYTPNRHRWLRTLADAPGTVRSGKGSPGFACMVLGWTAYQYPGSGEQGEVLTDAGRAQLETWDQFWGKPAAPAAPESFDERIKRALRPDGLRGLADWLVETGRAAYMLELLAQRAPERKVHVEQPEPAAPVAAAIEAQPVRAPQLGIRQDVPSGYVCCGSCSGRGTVRHNFPCHGCGGTGRVARTVAP